MDLQTIIRNIPSSQLYDLISEEQYSYIKNRNEFEYTNRVFQITSLVKLIGRFKGEMEKAEDIEKLSNKNGYKFILNQIWKASLKCNNEVPEITRWTHTRYIDTTNTGNKTKTRLKGCCSIVRKDNVFYATTIFDRLGYKKRKPDKQYIMKFSLRSGGNSCFNEKILDCIYNNDGLIKWL